MNRTFDIGDMKIGNITSVNYSTGYDYYEMKNNNYLSYDMAKDQSSYRYRYDDVQYKNTTKLGALFNWSLMKGTSKYEFRNFFNQRGTSSLSQREERISTPTKISGNGNPFIPDALPIPAS